MRINVYVKKILIGFGLIFLMEIPILNTAEARDLLRGASKPEFCRILQRHTPDADVTFQPGRDVNGHAVAAADLPSTSSFQLPERFEFPLTVDVIERLGIDQRQLGLEGNLPLGDVVVEQGRVMFNGSTVEGLSRADIVALCVRKPVVQ